MTSKFTAMIHTVATSLLESGDSDPRETAAAGRLGLSRGLFGKHASTVPSRAGSLERQVEAAQSIRSGRAAARQQARGHRGSGTIVTVRGIAVTISSSSPLETWRVLGLACGLDEPEPEIRGRACAAAGLAPEDLRGFRIAHRAVDARRRAGERRLHFVIHVDLVVEAGSGGVAFRDAVRTGRIRPAPERGSLVLSGAERAGTGKRAVVVGAGPGGLLAAWVLALHGYRVDLLDRGAELRQRARDLAAFHRTRVPNPESNLLFGEGGAGTYSDGKLYTRIADTLEVPILEELVACGAPAEICFDSRAHIGTDRLHKILPVLRRRLVEAGVTFRWRTRAVGLAVADGDPRRVVAVRTPEGDVSCDVVFVAPGHSARDTWEMLAGHGVALEAKPFQLGVRIEHPQELIDRGRYGGAAEARRLGPAYYNLVCPADGDRAPAHSFCMCPGGKIVASVEAPGHLCTNGMSNSKHSSPFANAAIVTTLTPATFGDGPFAGVAYRDRVERAFFEAGGGDYTAPAQRADDFVAGRASRDVPRTSYTFGAVSGRVDRLVPPEILAPLRRAIARFDRAIAGFAGPDGVLVGVESRSSCPVRVTRDATTRVAAGFENLYPVGEGAGYAGGIMSAAIDGARSAQAAVTMQASRR